MKILMMDTILPPEGNGWTTHKWELVRNLSKLGHEVHAMTYRGTEIGGVVTHTMKSKKQYKIVFIFKFVHLIHILKTIKQHSFDILYTRNVSFALLAFLMMQKPKLVLELNGLHSEDWKSEKKQYRMSIKQMCSYLEIFVAKKADAIIAVAPGIRDILIKQGLNNDKITVIPNGANIDLFKPVNDVLTIKELQTQYNISENDNGIIFVGNLMRWHGVRYLIKSAPIVIKAFPNTKFLIVGDGRIKKELISMTEKMDVSANFIFTGTVPYEHVPLYITISDVCVAPFIHARNERLGLSPVKIYEYLACGKPVVASSIRGIGDLLKSSNSGIVVTPEDPNELANAIIKLLKDERLREQMGKNGRELVVNNYSWKNAAKKTIAVFEEVING